MKTIISFFAFAALLACNNTKKTTETTSTVSTSQTTNMADSLYRLSVSFISIGAGTDRKAREEYDQYIIQYEAKNKIKLKYEISPWGREGENDYCFKLNELNENQQNLFIAESKEILKNSTLVRFMENMPCKQKRGR